MLLQLSQFFPFASLHPACPLTPIIDPLTVVHVCGSFLHVLWPIPSPSLNLSPPPLSPLKSRDLRKLIYSHFNFLQNVVNTCLISLLWGLNEMYLQNLTNECLVRGNNSNANCVKNKWNGRTKSTYLLGITCAGSFTRDIEESWPLACRAYHPHCASSHSVNRLLLRALSQPEFASYDRVRKSSPLVKSGF